MACRRSSGLFSNLLEVYTPRRMCMFYETPVIWLHFVSDVLIAASYYSIPIALVYFVKGRKDLVFKWVFWLFAAFILACGTTHLVGVIDLWKPFYKIDGLLKLATALLSVVTALTLWPLIPLALALPSRSQLETEVAKQTQELRRSNQALREGEERFRLVANSIPQLAWMAKADGRLFWYNQRWLDYTGGTSEEMDGWGWQKVHDPNELPRIVERWKRALDSGEAWEDTFPLRRHDGEMRRHLSRALPLKNDEGQVLLWFGTNTDIEDELRNVQALAQVRERLALSVEAAEIGTFYCPVPLGRIEWNDKCKEHFWLPPEAEVNFELFYSILHPDDRHPTRMAVEKAVFERQPYDVEYRTVALDGGMHWIRAKGRAYYDSQGSPTHFEGITIDVSHQHLVADEREQLLVSERNARAQAENASRLKDEFLATLSHELRTPLNAILGWANLLRRQNSDGELGEGLAVIERNSRVQAQLIEDLLDMSRIISGKLRIDVQRVDVAEVIRASVESIRPAFEAKEIRLQMVLDTQIGAVRGDPARLQQVFWNLLSNAVKFTPKGGKIQVALERVNSHIEITVTDTGVGISPEFLPHLFEKFRQADGTTTRRHGGLGLGLAIVKNIVELHGGVVRAKSPGVDQGATFSVELPLVIVHEDPAGMPRSHPRALSSGSDQICEKRMLQGVSVLVVDDEADARELVRRVLEECHAKVISASSGSEALKLLARERPDVILSDIGMPGMDGYELMRRIREFASLDGGETPAAALTAFARSDDRRRALVAGYQSHVSKPVEPEELVTVVASLAGKMRK